MPLLQNPAQAALWLAVLLIVALALSACSPTRTLNAVVPSGSYSLQTDITYGEHPRQRFDWYQPDTTTPQQAVVVFVYGGAWDEGSKEDFEFVGQAFARLGYHTIIPNYRLFPEVEFPAFITDVADALAALPSAINQCATPAPIILVGHSAGAHSAAMLLADPDYLSATQPPVARSRIAAFIGLAGPYDLPLEHERVAEKFSQVENIEANPVALIEQSSSLTFPPTLLLHGEADTIAKPSHSEHLAAALRSKGGEVELKIYPRRRHVALVASLASPLRFWAPAYQDIQTFLAQHHLNQSGCK